MYSVSTAALARSRGPLQSALVPVVSVTQSWLPKSSYHVFDTEVPATIVSVRRVPR